jgi:hypothetical protein
MQETSKSSLNGLPVVVIACKVFQSMLDVLLPPDLAQQLTYLDYGLHSLPAKLKDTLQETIDQISEPSLVVLGYGLCGNGLDGIHSRQHTLLVPRADDCIAMFIGSYQAFREEFDAHPGSYYLSKGWLESGSDPLREHQEYVEKYGSETADWLMEQQYQHYRRLVFVTHSGEDMDDYRSQAKQVAQYMRRFGVEYAEVQGSDQYIRELIAAIQSVDASNREFLLVPPNSSLEQRQFVRMDS